MTAAARLERDVGSFVSNLKESARENPVAAALIGAGVLWLLGGGVGVGAASRAGARRVVGLASDAGAATSEAVGSGITAARQSVSDLAGQATDRMQKASQGVGDLAGAAGARLGEGRADALRRTSDGLKTGVGMLSAARSNLQDVLEKQPLALGFIGLAVGALVAASVPTTQLEEKVLGESSDSLRDQAARFASRQMDRAADVASEIVDKVKHEARDQNVNVDSLKEGVEGAATKIGGVIDAAAESLRQQIRSRD